MKFHAKIIKSMQLIAEAVIQTVFTDGKWRAGEIQKRRVDASQLFTDASVKRPTGRSKKVIFKAIFLCIFCVKSPHSIHHFDRKNVPYNMEQLGSRTEQNCSNGKAFSDLFTVWVNRLVDRQQILEGAIVRCYYVNICLFSHVNKPHLN